MKRHLSLSLLLFTGTVLVTSCKKEDPNPDDSGGASASSPEITINFPAENDTVQPGVLHITGSITYTSEMHGYQVKLTNLSTSTEVLTSEEHDHASSYTIDESWTSNVSDTSDMELTVKAVKNHDGATVTKSVYFICVP